MKPNKHSFILLSMVTTILMPPVASYAQNRSAAAAGGAVVVSSGSSSTSTIPSSLSMSDAASLTGSSSTPPAGSGSGFFSGAATIISGASVAICGWFINTIAEPYCEAVHYQQVQENIDSWTPAPTPAPSPAPGGNPQPGGSGTGTGIPPISGDDSCTLKTGWQIVFQPSNAPRGSSGLMVLIDNSPKCPANCVPGGLTSSQDRTIAIGWSDTAFPAGIAAGCSGTSLANWWVASKAGPWNCSNLASADPSGAVAVTGLNPPQYGTLFFIELLLGCLPLG